MRGDFAHFAEAVDFPAALELFAAYASSELGRAAARALEPVADLPSVRRSLETVVEVQSLIASGVRVPLAGVTDVETLVQEAIDRGRPLEPAMLAVVAGACRAGINLRSAFGALSPDSYPRLRAVAERMPGLSDLETEIRLVVDDDRIRDTASTKLAEVRREMRELQRKIDAWQRQLDTGADDATCARKRGLPLGASTGQLQPPLLLLLSCSSPLSSFSFLLSFLHIW